jgi:predicted Rossmann-fold nucleotide-binding protein
MYVSVNLQRTDQLTFEIALGKALATQNRPLVYGGGAKGIMGVVSNSVLAHGGRVTGVIPYAMVIAGGEKAKGDKEQMVEVEDAGRERVGPLTYIISEKKLMNL